VTEWGRVLQKHEASLKAFTGDILLLHTDDDKTFPVDDSAGQIFVWVCGTDVDMLCCGTDFSEAVPMLSQGSVRWLGNRQLVVFQSGGHNQIFQMNSRIYTCAIISVLTKREPSWWLENSDSECMWWPGWQASPAPRLAVPAQSEQRSKPKEHPEQTELKDDKGNEGSCSVT